MTLQKRSYQHLPKEVALDIEKIDNEIALLENKIRELSKKRFKIFDLQKNETI